jgi:hypothetical protein
VISSVTRILLWNIIERQACRGKERRWILKNAQSPNLWLYYTKVPARLPSGPRCSHCVPVRLEHGEIECGETAVFCYEDPRPSSGPRVAEVALNDKRLSFLPKPCQFSVAATTLVENSGPRSSGLRHFNRVFAVHPRSTHHEVMVKATVVCP